MAGISKLKTNQFKFPGQDCYHTTLAPFPKSFHGEAILEDEKNFFGKGDLKMKDFLCIQWIVCPYYQIFFIVIDKKGYLLNLMVIMISPCPCCMDKFHKKEIIRFCQEAKENGQIQGQIIWKGYSELQLESCGFNSSWFREPRKNELEIFASKRLKLALEKEAHLE